MIGEKTEGKKLELIDGATLTEAENPLHFANKKHSRISPTLLSNYLLTIALLKNLSKRFFNEISFYSEFPSSQDELAKYELLLNSLGTLDFFVHPGDGKQNLQR